MAESSGQTDLNGAKLEGALLEGAKLPEEKFLVAVESWPDGKQYYNVEDLKRFTHRDHCLFCETLKEVELIRRAQEHVGEPEVFSDPD